MESRPWAEWRASKGASPKPITPNQLARLLKPFHIVSGQRAHRREHTQRDTTGTSLPRRLTRYLAAEGVSETQHRNKPTAAGTSTTFQNATRHPDVAFQKCEKPAPDAIVAVLRFKKGVTASRGRAASPGRACANIAAHMNELTPPLQAYEVDGVTYWLHPHCQQELAAPDPNGWTFNLET